MQVTGPPALHQGGTKPTVKGWLTKVHGGPAREAMGPRHGHTPRWWAPFSKSCIPVLSWLALQRGLSIMMVVMLGTELGAVRTTALKTEGKGMCSLNVQDVRPCPHTVQLAVSGLTVQRRDLRKPVWPPLEDQYPRFA